jgi:hypothetical protein
MRRLPLIPLASLLLWTAAADPARAVTPTPRPKTHGYAVSGVVVRVEPKRLLVVRSGGRETALVMTPATSVHGGRLAEGQRVAVRWLEKEGKHVATSVRIEPPAVAGTATPTVGGQP